MRLQSKYQLVLLVIRRWLDRIPLPRWRTYMAVDQRPQDLSLRRRVGWFECLHEMAARSPWGCKKLKPYKFLRSSLRSHIFSHLHYPNEVKPIQCCGGDEHGHQQQEAEIFEGLLETTTENCQCCSQNHLRFKEKMG